MKIIKTEGIILNKTDFGEGDRIVRVFTKEYGKLSIFLKGIRKSKKREKYASDVLNISNFNILIKENSELDICNNIELKIPFKIKNDMWRINLSFYMVSIIDKYLEENQKNLKLYQRLIKNIEYIEKEEDKIKILISITYFLFMIIKEEGIMFEFGDGYIFDIENSKIIEKNENSTYYKKLSPSQKNYIYFLNKVDINAVYELKLNQNEIFAIMHIFELYIEYHLNIIIKKIKNFLKEDI